MAENTPQPLAGAQSEVADLLSDLIRIDTTNTGDTSTSAGERQAAEWVAGKLDEVGISSVIHESEPGRASLVARIEGRDRSRPALLVHGHLDVVPADAAEWSVHPFSGEQRDGYVWGRGAVDMKDMDAMTLALVRDWARTGVRPERDIVLAYVADEEAGGTYGAHFMVDEHADLFEGCTEAISEVGGFSITVRDDLRLYLVQTAEKGLAWMRLTATGKPGHGSFVHDDNAVTRLCEAVARIGSARLPTVLTPPMRQFLDAVSDAYGIEIDADHPEEALSRLGSISRMIGAALRNTVNPTMVDAGYKANVIPGTATATIDGRFLYGQEEAFESQLASLIGEGIQREWITHDQAVETTFDGPLVDQMVTALKAEDDGARPVPFTMSGGTDAKSFETLGMRCFGFSPLRLPADLDFAGLFHGIDERVPVESLQFGIRVLDRFLRAA
ncbi:M20/M25/M40 family metallo-hydrolase [Modestobacter sp. I12A-02628]|uniref:M20/M25/M40 family metallo-hydrolase n=1 Tax=Goekera deserti TaxID=2497753 RepID=A0A7K3WE32_9ACTN|nr:M20/M25/M40 family metallo-hydrolase [Goekera deserti]MPQ99604.1 M20/M25/M40 family metallo-hydrolase [Goekera deserti]NDI46386.1 M20/M25/M40 family metallo-hydrolase [Goekera deserti]NEL54682.1 M20/M25/M40 family metallo-hydrolase [Goekera deserti]